MKISRFISKDNTKTPEELLSDVHIFCDYCGEEIPLSCPEIARSKGYPYPLVFSFVAEGAQKVGNSFRLAYAHEGACLRKTQWTREIRKEFEDNNETFRNIESIRLYSGEQIEAAFLLWEKRLWEPFHIWTTNNVYFVGDYDGMPYVDSVPRHPIKT